MSLEAKRFYQNGLVTGKISVGRALPGHFSATNTLSPSPCQRPLQKLPDRLGRLIFGQPEVGIDRAVSLALGRYDLRLHTGFVQLFGEPLGLCLRIRPRGDI